MISSIGQGFQNSINEMFAGIGAGAIAVNVRHDLPEPALRSDMLTLESAEFISTHPDVLSVAPVSWTNTRVQLRNPAESTRVQIIGTNEFFREIENVDIRFGRFLADIDLERNAPVVVIDSQLAREVFGRVDAVGETIRAAFWFGSVDLTVIGVYRNPDAMAGMFGMPTTAFIPITYFQRILNNNENTVGQIMLNAQDINRLDQTATEIARLLSLKHNNENRYQVTTVMGQLEMINDMISMVTGFVGLVAFISLAVGGIGVMNIMLVTVTERTREIGIRKSLGATDGNIQFQFLVEAMILTASGGVIGIIVGYYGGFALGSIIDLVPAISVPTVVITVLASSMIGIIFGVYPARKAAKLDPIEALRYE